MNIEEYRQMIKGKKTFNEKVDEELTKKKKASKQTEKLSTAQALQAMAHYFDLEEKKTKFFIRQLELSGKI